MALIYIVEDDPNTLELESRALMGNGFAVKCFDQAGAFMSESCRTLPDLVLLDLVLPGKNGLSLLKRLKKSPDTRDLPVIIVSSLSSEIDIVKGLDMGADDYITKPFGVMELIARVKAVLRRSRQSVQPEDLTLGEILVEPARRLCTVGGREVDLTYKEYELLSCLLVNAGIVMKRDILMERIWGIDFEGGSRTLNSHIKTLRKKLGQAGSHIHTVRNVGYLIK